MEYCTISIYILNHEPPCFAPSAIGMQNVCTTDLEMGVRSLPPSLLQYFLQSLLPAMVRGLRCYTCIHVYALHSADIGILEISADHDSCWR